MTSRGRALFTVFLCAGSLAGVWWTWSRGMGTDTDAGGARERAAAGQPVTRALRSATERATVTARGRVLLVAPERPPDTSAGHGPLAEGELAEIRGRLRLLATHQHLAEADADGKSALELYADGLVTRLGLSPDMLALLVVDITAPENFQGVAALKGAIARGLVDPAKAALRRELVTLAVPEEDKALRARVREWCLTAAEHLPPGSSEYQELLAATTDDTRRLTLGYGQVLAKTATNPTGALMVTFLRERETPPGAPGSFTEKADYFPEAPAWTQVMSILARLPAETDFGRIDSLLQTMGGRAVEDEETLNVARAVSLAAWSRREPTAAAEYLEKAPGGVTPGLARQTIHTLAQEGHQAAFALADAFPPGPSRQAMVAAIMETLADRYPAEARALLGRHPAPPSAE